MPLVHGSDGSRAVAALQERAARAQPVTRQRVALGIRLRLPDSQAAWWAGSALLHGPGLPSDLAHAVDSVEHFYRAHDLAPLVQVCPGCRPGLDDLLDRRGYEAISPVSVQVASARMVARRPDASSFHLAEAARADDQWLQVLLTTYPGPPDRVGRADLIGAVGLPSVFVTACADGRPVAVGRAVADTGWVGVFSMATAPAARRRGAGRAVLSRLARWAHEQHPGWPLYLQVVVDDVAPTALYRSAGFVEAYRYHYRRLAE